MKKIVTFFVLALFIVLLVGCSNPGSNSGSNSGSNNKTNYTITFNSNGGTSVSSITKPSGTSVSAPMNPTRSNYTFDGWYTTSSLTTKVSWPVNLNSNRTYYAGWKVKAPVVTNYTITFNTNGGSTVLSITRQSGTFVYAPMNPTKSGYTFDGWYTTSSLTTKVSWPVNLNSNRTYYAGWKSNVTDTSVTDSNFGTYFSATVKQTNISTSNSGTTLTFKVDVSSKSGVKSISSTVAVTFKVNVSYTYYNGRNTYSGSSYQTVTVYISSLSSQSKTITVKLSHSGPLASHQVSSFTYYNVSGKITR